MFGWNDEENETETTTTYEEVAKALENNRMRLTSSDWEIVVQIMVDLIDMKIDGMHTREISDKYGLSMKKTLYVMKELYATEYLNDEETLALDMCSNDGKDGFMKHTYWRMLDKINK
ncbi:hypothetical protein [Bdellovibrio sp. BCCA]|uniref:hypothetical protein n=1 Tax=Bdellovibrio sp. BCCA TaxID=3136281 RepID=UPI0030F29E28